MTRFTGERIIPDTDELQYTFARHEVVYRAIARHVQNSRVLDCGCGEGYGTNLLAEFAHTVTGLDRAGIAIQDAKKKYTKKNITFSIGDLEQTLPFPSQSFDTISCCQVVEHIFNAEGLLREFRRVLTEKGWALLSTPNRNTFSPTGDRLDPYHVREYTGEEFHQFLSQIFPAVRVYTLTGNATVLAHLHRDVQTIRRLTNLDVLQMRRWLPLRIKRWMYDIGLNVLRMIQHHANQSPISVNDFRIAAEHIPDNQVLDLIGVVALDEILLPNLAD